MYEKFSVIFRTLAPAGGIEPTYQPPNYGGCSNDELNGNIYCLVGDTGFEPVIFCSQSRRDSQASLITETDIKLSRNRS